MLNGLLRQQNLPLLPVTGKTCFERGTDDVVEQEGPVDEKRKAQDLQPLECFPAEGERNKPDEECPAGVD